MTNLLLRNIRMNGLVVLISIVGDKSHQCEEVVRTIRILFHLPVDLDIIMRDIIILVVIIVPPYPRYQVAEYQEGWWRRDASSSCS